MSEQNRALRTESNDPAKTTQTHSKRRRVLFASIAAGGASTALLPVRWSKPVVESLVLPAHAQATYTITCVGTPPAGTTYQNNDPVTVLVTVTPNPGAGQIIQVQGFCNGQPDFTDTLVTDSNGQATSMGTLGFCNIGENACVRFTYEGASTECCWTVGPPVVCLVHGTRVVKSTGIYVPIETLKVGDLVVGLSDRGARADYTVVTRIITNHAREACYRINGEISITNDHPVLVSRNEGLLWCPVEKLVPGDRIRSVNGLVAVNHLEFRPGAVKTVYVETSCGNFIVGGPDNEYVVKSTYAAQGIVQPVRAEEFVLRN